MIVNDRRLSHWTNRKTSLTIIGREKKRKREVKFLLDKNDGDPLSSKTTTTTFHAIHNTRFTRFIVENRKKKPQTNVLHIHNDLLLTVSIENEQTILFGSATTAAAVVVVIVVFSFSFEHDVMW